MTDERRMTFIIVPHGELHTRTYEISYRRLRIGGVLLLIATVVFMIMMASWWYVAAQAARVPGLQREVARLEEERTQVAELARTLAEVESQYEKVRQMLGADGATSRSVLPPLRSANVEAATADERLGVVDSWPLSTAGYITQELTGSGQHPGLDIAVPQDSYIRAAGPGVVKEAGEDPVYGQYVLIEHGGGLETMYGHASRLFVSAGDSVDRNELIALSGSTGRSTAPHLHFEVRRAGEVVDPLAFVQQP